MAARGIADSFDSEVPAKTLANLDPESPRDPPSAPTRLERVKHFTDKIRYAGKEVLTDDKGANADVSDDELFQDAAFNPQLVLDPSPHKLGSLRDKLNRGVKIVADAATNPRRAVRNRYTRRAAANLSKQPDNYIGVFDEDLVDAHDELSSALNSLAASAGNQSGSENDDDGPDNVSKVERAREKIDEIDGKRESRRNAWVLSRHIVRAKVVRPMSQKPARDQYIKPAGNDKSVTDWNRYLAHMALWYSRGFTAGHIDDFTHPPFDLRELALTIERLAVISTPWQSFLVDIRTIYRWADSHRTLRIMSFYWILWYFDLIIPCALITGIFLVIKNKANPTSVETIRDRVRRTQNLEAKARAWNELIQRHGNQDWIEPFLDDLGPLIQLHLGDLANFLEVLQNFYRWERPKKTISTLLCLSTFFLLVTFTSAKACLRLFWFAVGAVFFFSFPISTNYPRYRHIVSPLYWLFWDIPNAADLAIIQLQEKSLIHRASRMNGRSLRGRQREDSISDLDDSWHSASDVETGHDRLSLSSSENIRGAKMQSSNSYTFRAVVYEPIHNTRDIFHSPIPKHSHSRLTLTQDGLWLYNAHRTTIFRPYNELDEIKKIDLDDSDNDLDIRHQNDSRASQSVNDQTCSTKNNNHHHNHHHQDFFEDRNHETNVNETNSNNDQNHPVHDTNAAPKSKRTQINHKTTKLARRIHKWTALQLPPTGLEFRFTSPPTRSPRGSISSPIKPNTDPTRLASADTLANANDLESEVAEPEVLTLIVSEADRDRIFSLVLGWSNVKWMPLYSQGKQNRLRLRSTKGGGNKGLDDAIKRALR